MKWAWQPSSPTPLDVSIALHWRFFVPQLSFLTGSAKTLALNIFHFFCCCCFLYFFCFPCLFFSLPLLSLAGFLDIVVRLFMTPRNSTAFWLIYVPCTSVSPVRASLPATHLSSAPAKRRRTLRKYIFLIKHIALMDSASSRASAKCSRHSYKYLNLHKTF